jgi:hypothetical protein
MVPTVTTAGVPGRISRLTIPCKAVMICAAKSTGSFAVCGCDPCPPTPRTRMSTELTLA